MYIARLDVRGPYLFGGPRDDLFRTILDTTATEADRAAEDAFISGCYALASARAELLRGGTVYPIDAEFSFSLWCRWPLKPDVPAEFYNTVRDLRASIFTESGLDADRLAATVTDATLLLPFEGVYRLQVAGAFDQLFPPPQQVRGPVGA